MRTTTRIAAIALVTTIASAPAFATPLERLKSSGRITFGYLADARPFSFKNDAGAPDGYAIELCKRIGKSIEQQLALPGLTVTWKSIDLEDRFSAVADGDVDILCAPTSTTLATRDRVSYSIPIAASGNRAAVRADAPAPLRRVLTEMAGSHSVWKGTPAETVLSKTTFAAVKGTSAEQWIDERRAALPIEVKVSKVASLRKGLQQLLDGETTVLVGDRVAILGALGTLDAAARSNVVVLDRWFTHEPAALALSRDDDAFRLLVDRALAQILTSAEFAPLYTRWCGELDQETLAFFAWNTPVR
jgi:ABC-type amino acid transport substrate-binding protein